MGSLNIVRAVAALANGLGMATTAEGVETKEQLDTVRAEGCTEMQGFLFSRPLPADEIERLLLAKRKAWTKSIESLGPFYEIASRTLAASATGLPELLCNRLHVGDWQWGAIGQHGQQRCRCAKRAAGDAMVTGPASIFVLDFADCLGDLTVPLFPRFAPLSQKSFADVHVTQKFFTAIVAEAFQESVIAQVRHDVSGRDPIRLFHSFDFSKFSPG